ncbi:ISAs1 family transposase, partial [Bradyrhizobium sp. BRP22]|uniref:ISAs1 family transposase n=1 Tax=Bradyrhizobium sp. BRP22 TaxID=2793821 RepID=UPI001CD26519
NAGKTAKHKVRYFLASCLLSAKKLLAVVRAHWGIENNLHWVLGTVFDEDACRSRKDHAPENLAVIRKLAINILQATPGPARISHKCSRPDGTTTSFSAPSPICDSPTCKWGLERGNAPCLCPLAMRIGDDI